MMMHIVDQRQAFGSADRQEIGGRERLVVILDRQSVSNLVRKKCEVSGKIGQCLCLSPKAPPA